MLFLKSSDPCNLGKLTVLN